MAKHMIEIFLSEEEERLIKKQAKDNTIVKHCKNENNDIDVILKILLLDRLSEIKDN